MSYDQFGLDALKSGWDQGDTTGVFYDPWSWQQVGGRQFYLCFANWVISRTTIDAFLKQEPVEVLEGDRCQKCREAKERMHYCIEGLEELNRDIGICHECVQWANDYLSKPEPPPPPGTQFNLFA